MAIRNTPARTAKTADESVVTGHIRWLGARSRHGCHVSNGEQIVEVSTDNTYELPFITGKHRFVFIIPPDGYRCTTPFWSCSVHGPAHLANTDFKLKKMGRRPGRSFTALHITDTHVGGGKMDPRIHKYFGSWFKKLPADGQSNIPSAARMGRVIRQLIDEAGGVDFVIHTGDLTDWGEPAKLRAAARVFADLEVPVFPVFGGHDGNVERVTNGAGNFNAMYFTKFVAPPYYSWHWGGRHFISMMVESNFIDEETKKMQDAFIAEDLRRFGRKMPVTVCCHKHPYPFNVGVFRRYRVDSWLHGHFHSNRLMHDGKIRVFSTGTPAMGNIDISDMHGRAIRFTSRGKPTSRSMRLRGFRPTVVSRSSPIEIAWRSKTDLLARRAVPCVVDDMVFAGCVDESQGTEGGVIAFDRTNASVKWKRRLGESVEAPITAWRDCLIAVTHIGGVACLRKSDGKKIWEYESEHPYNRWVYTKPLVINNHVVIGTSSYLTCLSLRTGRKRWCWDEGGVSASDAMGRFLGPVADGSRILMLGRTGYVFDVTTGRVIRAIAEPGRSGLRAHITTDQGQCFVGGSAGYLCCFKIKTGKLLWSKRVSRTAIISGFIPFQDGLLGGTSEGVGRYSIRNGRKLAFRSFGIEQRHFVPYRHKERSCMGTPAIQGELAWVPSGDGYMNILQGKSLKLVARVALSAPIISGLAIADDGSAIGTDADGHLLAMRFGG